MVAVSNIRVSSNAPQNAVAGTSVQPLPPALTVGLSAQDILRVNAARPSVRTLKAGQYLYFQGDDCQTIYLLLDGWAFRHQSLEDGRRQILDFALPGTVFGLAGRGVMTHSVEALTPCRFTIFARDNLCELMQRVPMLAVRFVELVAGAEARAFEHLTNVGRRSARERVANLLMELLMRAGQLSAAAQTPRMTLPLMQPHIADALGLASETVCRVLAAMRRDGVVVLRAQKLEVLDINRLASEAGVELCRESRLAAAGRPGTGSPMWSRLAAADRVPAYA